MIQQPNHNHNLDPITTTMTIKQAPNHNQTLLPQHQQLYLTAGLNRNALTGSALHIWNTMKYLSTGTIQMELLE